MLGRSWHGAHVLQRSVPANGDGAPIPQAAQTMKGVSGEHCAEVRITESAWTFNGKQR
jgi:hypothetical protein